MDISSVSFTFFLLCDLSVRHAGRATYNDKLFKFRNGRFEDLLNDEINEHRDVANRVSGRSVACVDRKVTTLVNFKPKYVTFASLAPSLFER